MYAIKKKRDKAQGTDDGGDAPQQPRTGRWGRAQQPQGDPFADDGLGDI